MPSPMQNSPMGGGTQQNNTMGGSNSFAQNSPMSGGSMGAPQNNSMSGGQQFGGPSAFNASPMGGQQNTFNPYMGANNAGGSLPQYAPGQNAFNSAPVPQSASMPQYAPAPMPRNNTPMQGGIGSLQNSPRSMPFDPGQRLGNPYAQDPAVLKQQEFQNQMQSKSSEVMNSIPEYQQLQKMQQQLQGRQPSAQEMQYLQSLDQKIQGNSNFQQMKQQQQQMGQQFQQQYGDQLAELQAKDRQYNMLPQDQLMQAERQAKEMYERQAGQRTEPSKGFQAATQPYTPVNNQSSSIFKSLQRPTQNNNSILGERGSLAMPMPRNDSSRDMESMRRMFMSNDYGNAGRRRLV